MRLPVWTVLVISVVSVPSCALPGRSTTGAPHSEALRFDVDFPIGDVSRDRLRGYIALSNVVASAASDVPVRKLDPQVAAYRDGELKACVCGGPEVRADSSEPFASSLMLLYTPRQVGEPFIPGAAPLAKFQVTNRPMDGYTWGRVRNLDHLQIDVTYEDQR